MVLIVNSNQESTAIIRRQVQKEMLKNKINGTIFFANDLKEAKDKIKNDAEEKQIERLLILEVDDYEMLFDFIKWTQYKRPLIKAYIQYNALNKQKLQMGMNNVYLSESVDKLIDNLFIINMFGVIEEQFEKIEVVEEIPYEKWVNESNVHQNALQKALKSQLIMVAGSVFSTYDLAKQISKKYKTKKYKRQEHQPRILCMDLDLLNPSFDQLFGVEYKIKTINSHLMPLDCTGINLIIDAYRKEILTPKILESLVYKASDSKDIHYLFGNYNVANYEYYKWEELYHIINWVSNHYDYVILHTATNIYDEVTLQSMHVADQIYYCVNPFLHEVRNATKLLMYISNKQKISFDKFRLLVASSNITTLDWTLIDDLDNPLPIKALKKDKINYYENYKSYYSKNERRIQKQWQL